MFQIGHSLTDLRLANAFASSVKVFPKGPLKYLSSIRKLDISHNEFEILPETTLHAMHNLEIIRVHDCQLRNLKPLTFQVRRKIEAKD